MCKDGSFRYVIGQFYVMLKDGSFGDVIGQFYVMLPFLN